jgi:hypothetical protein
VGTGLSAALFLVEDFRGRRAREEASGDDLKKIVMVVQLPVRVGYTLDTIRRGRRAIYRLTLREVRSSRIELKGQI